MQGLANPAVDALRAQTAAYQLAFAIQGPFLAAIVGAAISLRRPGMRAYAIVYGLLSIASVSSAFSVTILTSGGSAVLHDVTLSFAMFTLAAAWQANRHAVRAMGGLSTARWPSVMPMLLAGVVTAVAVLLLQALPVPGLLGALLKSSTPRPFILVLMTSSCVAAWRTSRQATRNSTALQLVAISFLALVVRQVYGLVTAILANGGSPTNPAAVSFVQTSTTVLHGVALLAAIMLEERAAAIEQSELMRATEMRLFRAQRMENLGQMAGGIAHDFANVLTIIDGSVSGARESTSADDIDEHLEYATTAVERASDLTRQLALFARQRPPATSEFVVRERVQAIEPLLRRLIGANVVFSVESSTDARVSMDPSQFDQVLLNLVVNARDAMPSGGRVQLSVGDGDLTDINVTDRDLVREGPLVSIRVTDTGRGIPADTIGRIFEPFYSTKGDHGTGLGLATVNAVVRSARGAVEVISEVGRGTTFAVHLPTVAQHAPV